MSADFASAGRKPGEPAPDRPYVLVNRGARDYVRARYLADGMFELEHCTEGTGGQLYTSDRRMVRDVLWSWIERGTWWCDAVAWAPPAPDLTDIDALRDEMTGLLDGLPQLDAMTDVFDAALSRADALLADVAAEPGADHPGTDQVR